MMIDIEVLKESKNKIVHDLTIVGEKIEKNNKKKHSSEPIKRIEDVKKIQNYLLNKKKYRDYMLFTMGISLGIKLVGLKNLRFSDFIDNHSQFKSYYIAYDNDERGPLRHRFVPIDENIAEAIILFLDNNPKMEIEDYLFSSLSNRGRSNKEPLTTKSMDRILRNISREIGLPFDLTIGSLRNTYCYHRIVNSNYEESIIAEVQRMLNYRSTIEMFINVGFSLEEIICYTQM